MDSKEIIEKRKNNLKKKIFGKFSSNYDWVALVIIIFAAAFRYYYLLKTKSQAIWFDEGAYITLAKNFALGTPVFYEPHRDWFVSAIWSVFIKLGAGEMFLRFFTVSLGIATLYFFYVLVSHFFGKKIALFSMIFAAVFSESIFWSLRLDVGTYAMFFAMVSFVCFFKGIESKKLSLLLTSSAFAAFALMAHGAGILVPLFYIVFISIYSRFKFYKSKKFWMCLGLFILILSPYLIRNLISFGSIYPRFFSGPIGDVGSHAWNISGSFQYVTTIPAVIGIIAFILFLVGFFISSEILLGIDHIFKIKISKDLLGKIFFIILGLMSLASGMFLIASNTGFYFEPRFIIHFYFSAFVFASIGLNYLANYLKKHSKTITFLIIFSIFAFISYSQLTSTADLINEKSLGYQDIKQGGLWLKQNAPAGSKVMTFEPPQIIYYSDLQAIKVPNSNERILNDLNKEKPQFLILWAGVSSSPEEISRISQLIEETNNTIFPVAAFPSTNQPTLIIYKIDSLFYNNSR